jgi:signal transduction histidine kinase
MSEILRGLPARPARREDIAGFDLFEDLADDALDWLVEHANVVELAANQIYLEAGEDSAELILLLEGETEFEYQVTGAERVHFNYAPGEVTGVLPYSRMRTYPGRAIAVTSSRVLWIGREHFEEMVARSPSLGGRLVAIMADRVRDATRYSEQVDRMASLGKLAAGLAHELNNPASAVRRSASSLRQRLHALPDLVARLAEKDLKYEQVCLADRLRERAAAAGPVRLSAVERSEREDAMAAWLGKHDVAEPWVRAETLVEAGLGPEDVAASVEGLSADCLPDLLAWVEGGLAAERLIAEIDDAATRISDLVTAVKSYSHVDRAREIQPTDVRAGIETTLRILDHKLRRKNIRVDWDWQDVPAVAGYPGELNQVWTNLIDNALDAMEDGGTLSLGAARVADHVEICVTDDGAGIPEDLQARIFEPFFTTKDVGEGTGLGLDVVRRIVSGTHKGSIDVTSQPGRTTFRLHLPAARPGPPGGQA